jgi:hypothetical protein
MQVLLECCYIWMESSQWEIWNRLFCRKVSFLTAPHCQQLNQGFLLIKLKVITSNVLRSPPRLGWLLWNICVTNDHGYVPLVVNTFRSFPHAWLITDLLTRLTLEIKVITKLPNSEQSYKGKVKTHNWWLQLNQDRATRTPPKNGGELRFQLIKSNIKNSMKNSVILKRHQLWVLTFPL